LVVGLVRGLHGLNGAVRVEVLTDDESRFEEGSRVFPEGSPQTLTVSWAQPDAPGILLRFQEVPSREAAESLRDVYLEIDRPAAGLAEGEAYWHDVMGVPVMTTTGEALGTIADIFRAGESEVYVVRGGPRGEVLVPAVRAVVTRFEPTAGRIEVDGDVLGLEEAAPPRRARGRRSSRLPLGVVPQRVEDPSGTGDDPGPTPAPDDGPDATPTRPADAPEDGPPAADTPSER
jgi:16S rRNA processing protein RimM